MILPAKTRLAAAFHYWMTLEPVAEPEAIGKLNRVGWILAIACYEIADVVLTAYFIEAIGAVEQQPIAAAAIAHAGIWALVPLKALAFAVGYVVYRKLPNPYASALPLGLVALGMFLAGLSSVGSSKRPPVGESTMSSQTGSLSIELVLKTADGLKTVHGCGGAAWT